MKLPKNNYNGQVISFIKDTENKNKRCLDVLARIFEKEQQTKNCERQTNRNICQI